MNSRIPPVLTALTALLLLGYSVLLLRTWVSPSTDPQRGMATGFLGLVTFLFLGVVGLFWYGIARQRPGAVWTVFCLCALPSLSLLARGVYLLVRWWRSP